MYILTSLMQPHCLCLLKCNVFLCFFLMCQAELRVTAAAVMANRQKPGKSQSKSKSGRSLMCVPRKARPFWCDWGNEKRHACGHLYVEMGMTGQGSSPPPPFRVLILSSVKHLLTTMRGDRWMNLRCSLRGACGPVCGATSARCANKLPPNGAQKWAVGTECNVSVMLFVFTGKTPIFFGNRAQRRHACEQKFHIAISLYR